MKTLVYDNIGLLHLITAIIALVTGTLVLSMKKGTKVHKQIGYVYATNMLLLNATAFGIYRLFGGFGIFHISAMVSLLTLLGGMVPVLTKWPKNRWINLHYIYMYWSVIGLYAAFVSEVFTRIPETPFFSMLSITTFAVMGVAGFVYTRLRKRWQQQFAEKIKKSVYQP